MGRIIPNVWKNKKMFQTTNKFNLIWFNWENDPKNGIIVHDHLKVGMNGNDNLWCHFFLQ